MSTFGTLFRVTTFGESHCIGVGCVIDGCPARMLLSEADIQPQLSRRRPGQSKITTPRDEEDLVTIISGTERGYTLGTPIALLVNNLNIIPGDYKEMSKIPRPGHADFTYQAKYGIRASSGGGRASARETIGRVAAGAVAEKYLYQTHGVEAVSFVTSIGDIQIDPIGLKHASGRNWSRDEVDNNGTLRLLRSSLSGWRKIINNENINDKALKSEQGKLDSLDDEYFIKNIYSKKEASSLPCYLDFEDNVYSWDGFLVSKLNAISPEELENILSDDFIPTRCPHPSSACKMVSLIRKVKHESDSIGGTAMCIVSNVPIGLGEPCFDKLEAKLAHAMLSLPATKGFEIGSGFEGTKLRGSVHNDPFEKVSCDTSSEPGLNGSENGGNKKSAFCLNLKPKSNNAGGTLGGISSGADLVFKVAVKPVSTIGSEQITTDFDGNSTVLAAKGRHDPCVLARVPPLLESMVCLVLMDALLIQRSRVSDSIGTVADQEVVGYEADPTIKENKKQKI